MELTGQKTQCSFNCSWISIIVPSQGVLYLLKSQLILKYHFHGEMRMVHTITLYIEVKKDKY